MRENIYAFTESVGTYKSYPEFISVNLEDDGSVGVDIRSVEKLGSGQASIRLSRADAEDLARKLNDKTLNPHIYT